MQRDRAMSEFNLLEEVKKNIGLGGNDYHDQTIQSYIDEVKQYLLDGGCKPKVVNSPSSAGLIARGVFGFMDTYRSGRL